MLALNESNQIKGEHLYIDPLKTKCIIKKPIFSWNFYFVLEIKTNQLIRMKGIKGLNVKVKFVSLTFTSAIYLFSCSFTCTKQSSQTSVGGCNIIKCMVLSYETQKDPRFQMRDFFSRKKNLRKAFTSKQNFNFFKLSLD